MSHEEKTLRVTAVIPAYNEASCIGKTIAGLRGYVDEILVIDDGVARISEKLITWLAHLRAPVGDTGTGLRALRTELAKELKIEGKCICGVFSLEAAQYCLVSRQADAVSAVLAF